MRRRIAFLLMVACLGVASAGAQDAEDPVSADELVVDFEMVDAEFSVDPDTGNILITPIVAFSLGGEAVPAFDLPYHFSYTFADGSEVIENDHMAQVEFGATDPCKLTCNGNKLTCKEKKGSACAPINVTAHGVNAPAAGLCAFRFGGHDTHGRAQTGRCQCVYWLDAWPPDADNLPKRGSKVSITVDPFNEVQETDERNNTVVLTIPANL